MLLLPDTGSGAKTQQQLCGFSPSPPHLVTGERGASVSHPLCSHADWLKQETNQEKLKEQRILGCNLKDRQSQVDSLGGKYSPQHAQGGAGVKAS